METIETYRVIEGERSLTFTNKFDALRWAVRYKGEDSLKMVESVTLYELADHPWLTLHPETWVELYSVVAEDLARADGVTLEAWVCPNGDTHYTDKGQDAFEEFVTQAEQLMTDSGLTKGEY